MRGWEIERVVGSEECGGLEEGGDVGLVGDELEAGTGRNGPTELGSISVPQSDIEAGGWKQLSESSTHHLTSVTCHSNLVLPTELEPRDLLGDL
jgi:hypothetical protein